MAFIAAEVAPTPVIAQFKAALLLMFMWLLPKLL